jgi:hypothetical protein
MSSTTRLPRRIAAAAAVALLPVLMLWAVPAAHGDDVPPPIPTPAPRPGGGTVNTDGTKAWEKSHQAVIRVWASEIAKDPITVILDTSDGTAIAPEDYRPIRGKIVTIPAGSSFVDVPIALVDDDKVEPDEFFTVTISKPSWGRIGNGTATVVIHDGGPPR